MQSSRKPMHDVEERGGREDDPTIRGRGAMTSSRASLGSSAAEAGRPVLSADLIVAHAPDPVFVLDLEGKINEANAAVSQLLGLRRDEVLEQSLSRFLGPAETQEFVAAIHEAVERGVARDVRLHPRCASGDVIPTTLN